MVLSTHAVIGASLAGALGANPALGFLVGVVSHFAIDAIPHWDYQLRSVDLAPSRRNLQIDAAKILLDLSLGFLACLGLFGGVSGYAVISSFTIRALGGIFPDLLQVVYFASRRRYLARLQRFHQQLQTNKALAGKPWLGASLQVALAALVYLICALLSSRF